MRRVPLNLRVRLALLFGGLFLLAGILLVFLVYFLVKTNFPTGDALPTGDAIDGDRPGFGEVARRILDRQQSVVLDTLLQQSLIALAITAALAAAAGWMMAGRVLRPVRRITETAQRVAERNLHERIGMQGPDDELKELADTFDAMLERLDRAFDSQRRFVANASHEMRTPLAINRTLLEVALANGDAKPELRQLHTTMLTTNERSERMVDGLLTLARSENRAIKYRPVDLSDAAAYAVEQTASEASAAGVQVRATPDPAPTTGDPALLERLALNLVQNGIRHNHREGWVEVVTGYDKRWVELTVTNTGPEVPPYDVEELFEPFRRLGGGRTGGDRGIGLGLSIVRSVANTHGGEARATPRSGGGLVVRVRLPRAADNNPGKDHSGPDAA